MSRFPKLRSRQISTWPKRWPTFLCATWTLVLPHSDISGLTLRARCQCRSGAPRMAYQSPQSHRVHLWQGRKVNQCCAGRRPARLETTKYRWKFSFDGRAAASRTACLQNAAFRSMVQSFTLRTAQCRCAASDGPSVRSAKWTSRKSWRRSTSK